MTYGMSLIRFMSSAVFTMSFLEPTRTTPGRWPRAIILYSARVVVRIITAVSAIVISGGRSFAVSGAGGGWGGGRA